MIRHGIVLPLPNVMPPPECRGGPAFCPVCNAEMIELEETAFAIAVVYARHEWKWRNVDEQEIVDGVSMAWAGRTGFARKFRRQAAERIVQRLAGAAARSAHARHAAMSLSPEARIARARKAAAASNIKRWAA